MMNAAQGLLFVPLSLRVARGFLPRFAVAKQSLLNHHQTVRTMATTTTTLPDFGRPSYGLTKKITGKDFDTVVDSVSVELKQHGFGILTKIDMKETMKSKISVDLERPYVILGACNPQLAHAALQSVPAIGLFLPCNIVVAQDGDESIVVSVISPQSMFSLVDNTSGDDTSVSEMAKDVQETMTKLINAL